MRANAIRQETALSLGCCHPAVAARQPKECRPGQESVAHEGHAGQRLQHAILETIAFHDRQSLLTSDRLAARPVVQQ